MLVIGPMGSGKTEYSARIWRDSSVILKKSESIAVRTTTGNADRRKVFFIRSLLDAERFPEYPADALAYRGGYERCGSNFAVIKDSFDLENVIKENPAVGTWIIDEATFYDERIAYVIRNFSEKTGLNFVLPTLILNFRRDIFNATAQFILELSTDVFPLTAYCEHSDCIENSYYTYRYYSINGEECPALYFDPLIVIGGDREKDNPMEPNYCTRCDIHHYLPGKEYTYLTLKPLGQKASQGDINPLKKELEAISKNIKTSELFRQLSEVYVNCSNPEPININSLKVFCIAEKALIFLFAEQNLLTEEQVKRLIDELSLDRNYIRKTLEDNKRPINLEQYSLNFDNSN